MSTYREQKDTIFGVLSVLLGLGVLMYGIFQYYEAKSSISWESTTGRVIKSTVETNRTNDGITYTPIIIYAYKVRNKSYQSGNIYFGESSTHNSKNIPQALVNKYPLHSEVTVYYEPQAPFNSILQTGVTHANYFYLIFGIGLILLGIFVIKKKIDEEKFSAHFRKY